MGKVKTTINQHTLMHETKVNDAGVALLSLRIQPAMMMITDDLSAAVFAFRDAITEKVREIRAKRKNLFQRENPVFRGRCSMLYRYFSPLPYDVKKKMVKGFFSLSS